MDGPGRWMHGLRPPAMGLLATLALGDELFSWHWMESCSSTPPNVQAAAGSEGMLYCFSGDGDVSRSQYPRGGSGDSTRACTSIWMPLHASRAESCWIRNRRSDAFFDSMLQSKAWWMQSIQAAFATLGRQRRPHSAFRLNGAKRWFRAPKAQSSFGP